MMNRSTTAVSNLLAINLLVGLALCTSFGCGGSKTAADMASVTGKVTLQGQPVAGANVTFYPAAGGDAAIASQATTDSEGKFELVTQTGGGKTEAGIAPGRYDVAIIKLDMSGVTSTSTPPKNVLPPKYANPKTSKLSADVTADGVNHFDFAL